MNLKKIFSALKKSSNAYAVPNEFRLTDILGEDDLLANRKLTAASYSLTWQNPPQSALVFMAFPYGLNGGGPADDYHADGIHVRPLGIEKLYLFLSPLQAVA